ncbi:MAG: hypothetical protein HY244_11910 [Rhizobiales bacterium]|nr:hypothetical protein [Hyphomicrobiales bacterium]
MRIHRHIVTAAALIAGLGLLAMNGASAKPAAKTCGGVAGVMCPGAQYCDYKAGQCRFMERVGVCIVVPTVCTLIYKPVCGCDGKTYGNDCVRQAHKVQLDHTGVCAPAG